MFGSEHHAKLGAFPRLKRLTNSNEGVENFDFDKNSFLGRRMYALVKDDNIKETEDGFDVTEVGQVENWDISSAARGFFEHDNRDITIRNFKIGDDSENVDIAERLSALIHEVAHSLLGHNEDSISEAKKEMEAEAVAYVVCQRLDVDTDAGVYIANHLHNEADVTDEEEVRSLVKQSIGRIGETSSRIFEEIR